MQRVPRQYFLIQLTVAAFFCGATVGWMRPDFPTRLTGAVSSWFTEPVAAQTMTPQPMPVSVPPQPVAPQPAPQPVLETPEAQPEIPQLPMHRPPVLPRRAPARAPSMPAEQTVPPPAPQPQPPAPLDVDTMFG